MQWVVPSGAAGLVLGVVWSAWSGVGGPWWWLGALVWGVGWWRLGRRLGRVEVGLAVLGALVGVALHGGAQGGGEASAWADGAWRLYRGEVVEGSRPLSEGRSAAVVSLDRCGEASCGGRVRVVVGEGGPELASGDRVWVGGEWVVEAGADAPYLWDGARWMARQGLAGRLVARGGGAVARVEASSGWAGRLERWRLGRERWVEGRFGGRWGGLLLAMVTGSRGLVSEEAREPIDAAGLSHLFAISGLHLVTVGGAALWAERGLLRWRPGWLRRRWVRWGIAALALALALGYGTLAGWPVSARRAALMFTAWLVGRQVEEEASLEVGLALAVMCVVVADSTWALWDPGLQLSVCAVAGLAVATRGEGVGGGLAGWARSGLLVSLGSTAACMPWTLLHFGRVPAVGLVLNLVAVPLVQAVVLPLGLVGVALGPGWGEWAVQGALWGLEVIWRLAESCPWAGFEARLVWPGGLAGVLVVGAALARRWPRVALGWVGVGSLLCGLWGPGSPGPEVRFLPVGQGDAILLRDGAGRTALIDGGGVAAGRDPGRAVVLPALRARGLRRLDVVVVSHGDLDHIGGLVAVVEAMRPREVWWSGPRGLGSVEARLLRACARVGAQVREPPDELVWEGLRVRRLDPPLPWHIAAGVEKNERSLGLEVELGGARVLLTGDAEEVGEWRMLPQVRPVEVMKAGHHGSRTSSTEALLRRAQPRVAVISSGRGNRFGHPHEEVVDRYARFGARVYNTAPCGEIWIGVEDEIAFIAAHRRCVAGASPGPGAP